MLGHRDELPRFLTEPKKARGRISSTDTDQPNTAAGLINKVYGPYRVRRLFQALPTARRGSLLLDPFFVGDEGLAARPDGRDWLISRLVPKDAKWRQMAIDLTDGYVAALQKHHQKHLENSFSQLSACFGRQGEARTDFARRVSKSRSGRSERRDRRGQDSTGFVSIDVGAYENWAKSSREPCLGIQHDEPLARRA